MIEIIFEAHGTTLDNEAHLASGWNDVELSDLGKQQSREMGERYKNEDFDAIFVSDFKRAVDSAKIAFEGRTFSIVQDDRLRECNYGDLTQHPSLEVDPEKPNRINTPFPNGESYTQTTERMRSFLQFLSENYAGKRIMIIGHRATQYGLENLILGKPLQQVIPEPWSWQPGWVYQLTEI
jgi:broad specificity phosphatase PhoE